MSSRKPKKDVRGKPGPKQLTLSRETLKDLSAKGKGPVGGLRGYHTAISACPVC
jgi:hypothetical protein